MVNLGRILLADDEKNFLEAHADLLREEGYVCDCAADADTAKKLLMRSEYDLLIADIKMPGNNELELIESLPAIRDAIFVLEKTKTSFKSKELATLRDRLEKAITFINKVH
jgi:DNA-binding response OmpR family regulator